jgi:hypothetical protein
MYRKHKTEADLVVKCLHKDNKKFNSVPNDNILLKGSIFWESIWFSCTSHPKFGKILLRSNVKYFSTPELSQWLIKANYVLWLQVKHINAFGIDGQTSNCCSTIWCIMYLNKLNLNDSLITTAPAVLNYINCFESCP